MSCACGSLTERQIRQNPDVLLAAAAFLNAFK